MADLKKPVDWDELYPGRFLKAGELRGKRVTLTIASVDLDELVGEKGKQTKGVISFKETAKQIALNKTNGICLREMLGRKLLAWEGRRITIFPGQWNGDDCIRIWGSPELESDREITVQLPRKKPFKMTMHAVRKAGAPALPAASSAEEQEEAPESAEEIETGFDEEGVAT